MTQTFGYITINNRQQLTSLFFFQIRTLSPKINARRGNAFCIFFFYCMHMNVQSQSLKHFDTFFIVVENYNHFISHRSQYYNPNIKTIRRSSIGIHQPQFRQYWANLPACKGTRLFGEKQNGQPIHCELRNIPVWHGGFHQPTGLRMVQRWLVS